MNNLPKDVQKLLKELEQYCNSKEYQNHLEKILEEIKNDPNIAVGHCGSYG